MNNIGIVGAGIMGLGIAQVAANAGCKVILFDTSRAALDFAQANLQLIYTKLVEKNKTTHEQAKNVLSRIVFSSKIANFNSCELVIEAVVEDLLIKQKLFSDIEKVVSRDCILASNTSSLSITSLASICVHPKRVVGVHFFNPAVLMPLVEIISGIATEKVLLEKIKIVITKWNKIPVVVKDTPGFIVNRIARPFYGEAIRIYEEGIADFATIDWAMKEIGGFKMGPFELMDLIGNDVNYRVTEAVWKQLFYDPKYKPSLTQKKLVEAKLFGRKTGKGYYDYSLPFPMPVKDKLLGEKLFFRVWCMLINEAADALYYKIATKEDLDLAMKRGANYPKGLLEWADEVGLEKVAKELDTLYDEYQEERYRTSILLKSKVRAGTQFY